MGLGGCRFRGMPVPPAIVCLPHSGEGCEADPGAQLAAAASVPGLRLDGGITLTVLPGWCVPGDPNSLPARFRAEAVPIAIKPYGITTLCAPPAVWRMLIHRRPGHHRVKAARGGQRAADPEVIERMRPAWGLTIRDGFGQTSEGRIDGAAFCPADTQCASDGLWARAAPMTRRIRVQFAGRARAGTGPAAR
jgi:hypothetical protein